MKNNNQHINKNGFKVPKNYFESFDKKLYERIASEEQEISLENIKLETGFKVPNNYFDTIEDKILNYDKPKIITLFSKQNLLYISSIAATIAIIIFISINKETELDFSQIAYTDIQEYLISDNIELSDEDISELLDQDIDLEKGFSSQEEISNEMILDYLSDDTIENEIIYIE